MLCDSVCIFIYVLPAAKCSGDDLLPAVSLAFTLEASTRARILRMSPPLQASNKSRIGSVGEIRSGLADRDISEEIVFILILLIKKVNRISHLSAFSTKGYRRDCTVKHSIFNFFLV